MFPLLAAGLQPAARLSPPGMSRPIAWNAFGTTAPDTIDLEPVQSDPELLDYFGLVITAPDFTRDKYTDLAVGAPGANDRFGATLL